MGSTTAGPFERPRAEAEQTTGICLSGGGLRAASFAFGILQILQRDRGALYGRRAANWLAVVSGGSYIAGAYILGGRQRAADPARYEDHDPLAPGSAEENHILAHGRYLRGAEWRWPCLWLLTFSSLVILFMWGGFLLADLGGLAVYLPDAVTRRLEDLPSLVSVAGVFAGVVLTSRALYSDSRLTRGVVGLPGFVLIYLGGRPTIRWASRLGAFSTVQAVFLTAGLLVLVMLLLAVVTVAMRKYHVLGRAASVVNVGSAFVAYLLGVVLLGGVAVAWYPDLRAVFAGDPSVDSAMVGVALAATLIAPLVWGSLPARASLHREYRRRLESCFGIVRGENGHVERVTGASLSIPPPSHGALRFPQLLVCATANVRGHGPDGRRWTFRPFVLSHDRCGVPDPDDAGFATEKLELGRVPAGVVTRRKEPLISLFTAIAATGAAVAPSMGRYTVPSARALIAVLNIRLGRWVPNPYSARAQAAVAGRSTPGTFDKDKRLASGYDELIPEMLGFDGPRVYLSDGGHYDNLGLVDILRRQPSTIWCVDASPDPEGEARELMRVLAIAATELRLDVDTKCDEFNRLEDGLFPTTHTVRQITYRDGKKGRLIVLKLGLTRESDPVLLAKRQARGFPFHPTWRQVYGEARMDAYRRLGQDVAERALAGCLEDGRS